MSPEKALNYLDESNFDIVGEEAGRIQEAFNLAKEALTKTMICEPNAKKDEEGNETGDYTCSVCKKTIDLSYRFCPYCGQKLK